MLFTRALAIASAVFSFGLVAASPIANVSSVDIQRRQSDPVAILNEAHVAAVAKALEIQTVALTGGDPTDSFGELIAIIDGATTKINAIPSTERAKRQGSDDELVATAFASMVTDISNALAPAEATGLLDSLLPGLDTALNNLINALLVLVSNLLTLVAVLLEDVADLLRKLALALLLVTIGL